MTNNKRDYLAIILIGAGSSWARGPDRDDVIKRVQKLAVSDWSSLFDLAGKEATVNIIEVTGRSEVWWDHQGIHSKEDAELGALPKPDAITVTLPAKRRARA